MKELIGKRVLVTQKGHDYSRTETVVEIKIIEVSPSGQWTRIMNEHGNKIWKKSADISPIEILAVLEKYPLL